MKSRVLCLNSQSAANQVLITLFSVALVALFVTSLIAQNQPPKKSPLVLENPSNPKDKKKKDAAVKGGKGNTETKAKTGGTLPPPAPPPALTPREAVLSAMKERPGDYWSRPTAHAILALPGSTEKEKAYFEPGGSFSPAVGSFGVSLWLVKNDGKASITTTSDEIPLKNSQVYHRLVWGADQNLPGIKTECWAYEATWTSLRAGKWELDLRTKTGTDLKIVLFVRSVGPAGGDIKSLKWEDNRLIINSRWGLSFSQSLPDAAIRIGQENATDWKTALLNAKQREFSDGWGFAKIDLSAAKDWKITISDPYEPPPPPIPFSGMKTALHLDIPDGQFKESLRAQVAHLLMGLDARQVWPGDPLSYTQKRVRDGAYVIAALARVGQLAVAKELLREYEKSFFRDTETDAPGFYLWAAEEVAARENQSAHDNQLWPQIVQKAKLIEQAAASTAKANCFATAINYRGLLSAATLAERLKKMDEAKRWRAVAEGLKQSWQRDFLAQPDGNERVYFSGLWPSGVALTSKDSFGQGLERRWLRTHHANGGWQGRPSQTYFELADAHQWLLLHKPEKTWLTLEWFWANQAIPGLYTWWESLGADSPADKWKQVRGWVNPSNVTPQYWTAAEMLLLQLDMLLHVEGTTGEVVIGAGAASTWMNQPMSVRRLPTSLGEISWEWEPKKKEMTVYVPTKQFKDRLKNKVTLGVNFPPKAKVNVEVTK
jgi:hypothetical protein